MWEFKYSSWDDVFGAPHPKNTKAAQHRKYKKDGFNVYQRVKILRSKKRKPRDIFRTVGLEFKISEATAKRFFDRQRKWWDEAWEFLEEEESKKLVQQIEK